MRVWLLIMVTGTLLTGAVAVHLTTQPLPAAADERAPTSPSKEGRDDAGASPSKMLPALPLVPGSIDPESQGDADGATSAPSSTADDTTSSAPAADPAPESPAAGTGGTGSEGAGADPGAGSSGDGAGEGSDPAPEAEEESEDETTAPPPAPRNLFTEQSFDFAPNAEPVRTFIVKVDAPFKRLWFNVTYSPGAPVGASSGISVRLIDPALGVQRQALISSPTITAPESHVRVLDDPAQGDWRVQFDGTGTILGRVTVDAS